MRFSDEKLPVPAKFIGASDFITEKSIPAAMLARHAVPYGRQGVLRVRKGNLHFVWEDTGEIRNVDPAHPMVIPSERFHHIRITGPVIFRIEYYAAWPEGIR